MNMWMDTLWANYITRSSNNGICCDSKLAAAIVALQVVHVLLDAFQTSAPVVSLYITLPVSLSPLCLSHSILSVVGTCTNSFDLTLALPTTRTNMEVL